MLVTGSSAGRPAEAAAQRFDVAIVGAGISGLSAAESILARARAREVPLRLTIYEAGRRASSPIVRGGWSCAAASGSTAS